MPQQTQSLRYGDLVRIHGVNINKQRMPQGLIIAKGFTDSNIYYQTYQKFDEVNFYRESLFQILPKSNFDLHDQYLDYLANEKVKNPQERKTRKQKTLGQIENLFSQLQNKAGKELLYGAEVVFRHVESQQYLCGVLKAADIGEGAFKLQLRADLSSQVLFQIQSHRTYEHQGNNVYYDDCLQLYHKSSDCYVNFPPNTNDPAFLDKKQEKQILPAKKDDCFKYFQQRPRIKKPFGVRIPIINENKSKCLWKFINHCSYKDYKSKEKIKSHDIVYFQHTKKKGLVASTLADKKYYLKEEKQKSSEGPSYECFWQLVPKQVNQFGPETCEFFWARNIVTGQILTYDKEKESSNIQIQSKQKIQGGGFKSEGLINLICSEFKKLERGEPIPLDSNMSIIEKYFEQKIQKVDFKAVDSLPEDSFIIVKVGDDTIRDVAYVLSSHEYLVKFVQIFSSKLLEMPNKSEEEYKKIFMSLLRVEDFFRNVINILKLLCGKIYATEYEEIQSSGNTPIPQIQKILVQTGIPQLLIEIVFLLFEPFQQIEKNNQPSEDKVIRNRIVEIFEISYRLLQKIANGYEDNRIYLSRWVDLFLSHSKKINKPFIQETLVCILQNNPVSIEQTIDEQKIQELIESFFAEARPIIDNPASEEFLTTKYLRLFSTFIKCEDRVLKENQTIILNKFFNREDNNFGFKFKVEYTSNEDQDGADDFKSKEKAKKAKVSFGRDEYVEIPVFYQNHRNKFNYLMSYINLLADVCMDRNNYAIESVEFIMPLSVVSAVLVDDDIINLRSQLEKENQESIAKDKGILFPQTNIHEPFIRIAHHAYVNNEKFSPIKRIKRIKNWYKAYEQEGPIVEDINKTKRVYQGEKEEQQKQYLKYIRDYIKEFIQNCDQSVNNLQILNTVLNLLKETIILGLWDQIQDFRQMIPDLVMKILKIESIIFFGEQCNGEEKTSLSKEEIMTNKDKIKLNRPEIALLIDCKIKATEIFKCMNEMQMDIRLRYLMHFFQGLYDATQNFEVYNLEEGEFQVNIQDSDEAKKEIVDRNESAREEFFKVFGSIILGDIKKVSEDQDIMLKENIWYNKLKKMIPIEYKKSSGEQSAGKQMKEVEEDQFDQTSGGDRNLFKVSESFDTIILSLFELSGYQNKNLLNSTLTMLRSMFGQRRDLIENYKEMLICGKGNLNQVYLTLKFMRNKFDILQNHSILKFDGNVNKSFPYAIWKPYDHLGRQESKRSGIIQDLFFLARTLKDNVSLKNIESLMHVEEQVFKEDIVYNFYNERERNNSLFQELNMAEGIYIPLINYIKLVGDSQITEIHRKLLFSIYQYLTLLCFNNMKAKHILMRYIPDILKHLNKKVGAASFLYEVCINNKLLVNNEELVSMILDKALKACVSLEVYEQVGGVISTVLSQDLSINLDFEKSRILYSLRGVLLFGDEGHKKNQAMLMDKLQDNNYRRLVYKGPTTYSEKLWKFDLSPPEAYAATHFQLFSTLVESENLINIGKLENLHSYDYCLDCLKTTNRWQLRRALRSYVNRLYYINKDKDIFMFEEFIRNEFDNINKELKDLIELHRSKMLTEDLKIKNGIRFVYALSEIMLMIIEILVSLHQIFLKPEFIKLLKRQLAKEERASDEKKMIIHSSLIYLLQNLGCILLLYPKTKPIAPFIKEIKRLITPVLETFHVRYLEKQSEPKDTQNNKEQKDEQSEIANKKGYSYDHSRSFFRNLCEMIRDLKSKEKVEKLKDEAAKRKNQINMSEGELKQKYIDVIFQVQGQNLKPILDRKVARVQELHYKPHLQTAHSKIFRVLAKPDLEQNQQNIELNKRLNSVKELMEDAPIFKKLKDDEFYNLVRIFKKIDDTSADYYSRYWPENESVPIYSRKQIIKSIFSLVMNNPTEISDNQKIFVIKLVRCYISESVQQHQNYKLSVDKWNADYYTDESNAEQDDEKKSELVRRQHEIQQCGGSDFIISIFKENLTDRVELLNEALLLGIIYLYNGNKRCQNSILKSLKADPDNLMLISMKNIISFIGNFLIEVRKMKDYEKVRNFAYKSVDSYDHFNVQEKTLTKEFGHNSSDKFQIQTELNFELALCRSFRFLQLFCQSNNTDMKNFLLTQTNDDESRKTNSINFVSETCLLSRKLFKIMNNKVVGIPSSILDFINEITQIPCIETQLSLLRSTFFEDISYMAGFFESKENIRQRKFNFVANSEDDPLNQLCEIYQKGIGLAMSNFQGNDNEIVWEFLNKAQPKYLWIVIKQNIVLMLKERADEWKISKDDIDKELENDHEFDKETLREYRQFIAEEKYIKALFDNFNLPKIRKLIQNESAKGKTFRNQICNIINVISILKKIDDYAAGRQKEAFKDKQNPNLEQNEKAFKARNFRLDLMVYGKKQYKYFDIFMEEFEGLIRQIEVASFNGREESFQNLYFPNHPVFTYLAEDTKDSIMLEVSRDTQRDKLISLFSYYENIKEEIEQNYQLNYWKFRPFGGKEMTLSITSNLVNRIRQTARYVSYFVCALMLYLIVVDHDTAEQTSYFTYYNYQDKLIMRIICGVQLTLTILFFVLWLVMKSKLSLEKYRRDAEGEEQTGGEEAGQQEADEQQDNRDHWLARLRTWFKPYHRTLNNYKNGFFDKFSGLKDKMKENILYQKFINPVIEWVTRLIHTIIGLHTYESGFLSILVFVISSFLGNFVGVEWYTMHLFDFFVGISLLTNVFKAILDNIKLLGLLSGLAGCFILVFNIISLNTYVSVIYEEEVPTEACEDFLGCVLELYTSGAIGDDMDQLYVGRFMFDTLYVVFMEMIFQGLVGGIIIDAFMGLKQADSVRDEDKKNNCYICAMQKPDMEKMGTTFNKHIAQHYLWNYIFYKYCLDMKDQTDYTGMEYAITEKIGSENVSWFPDNGEKDMSGQIEQLVEKLKENIDKMKNNSESLIQKGELALEKISGGVRTAIDKNNELKQIRDRQAPRENGNEE